MEIRFNVKHLKKVASIQKFRFEIFNHIDVYNLPFQGTLAIFDVAIHHEKFSVRFFDGKF